MMNHVSPAGESQVIALLLSPYSCSTWPSQVRLDLDTLTLTAEEALPCGYDGHTATHPVEHVKETKSPSQEPKPIS